MFKIKHLEGGKFKLEKERGSSIFRDKKTSTELSTGETNFKNIRDKFEFNRFQDYTHIKTSIKSANILSTPTKRRRGTERGYN